MRSGLRSNPAGGLRLTARKLKNYIEPTNLNKYTEKYSAMIDSIDNVDYYANLRIREGKQFQGAPLATAGLVMGTQELKKVEDTEMKVALTKAITQYDEFLQVIKDCVEFTPEPKPLEITPTIVS